MESVGVRELRQNASVLLNRVESSGISIEITNHGHPVARLVPIERTDGVRSRAQLIADGTVRPGRGDPLAIEPVPLPPGSPSTAELLDEGRQDR